MAFFFVEHEFYTNVPIGTVAATQPLDIPLGLIARARDPVYGAGTFIFLAGVAATVLGSLVYYSAGGAAPTFVTTLVPNTGNQGRPIAVATAAIINGTWGWFQLQGIGVMSNNGTVGGAQVPLFVGGVGQCTSTAAAGKQILGCESVTATGTPAANQNLAMFNFPSMQGQIT